MLWMSPLDRSNSVVPLKWPDDLGTRSSSARAPAGAAAAYDLARAGRRVLLVDKAEFPRPKACAGGLTMRAVRALRYPVDPVVRRVACEIVLESDGSGPPVSRALPVRRRNPLCLMTVREELDAYCLARTLEAGAVLQRIPSIDSINATDCRVTLTLAGGAVLEARTLIAADGVHSRVRTLLDPGASWHRKGFAIEANVALDGNFAPPLTFDFGPRARRLRLAFPTPRPRQYRSLRARCLHRPHSEPHRA